MVDLADDRPLTDAELAVAFAEAVLNNRLNPGSNQPFQPSPQGLLAWLGLGGESRYSGGRATYDRAWAQRFYSANPTLEFRLAEYCWRLVGLGFLVPQTSGTWGAFHLTDRGRVYLSAFDPAALTTGGIDEKLATIGFSPNDLPRQYARHAQDCFLAGHYESSVVMLGVSSESLIEQLADAIANARPSAMPTFTRRRPSPATARQEMSWITDALENHTRELKAALRAKNLDDLWIEPLKDTLAGTGQSIRLTRNDYGHPTGITADQGQALELLNLFPRFAQLCAIACDTLVQV